ncbi:hypothetical protein SKAU_G00040660 [Synaphobranchus kaupii]|uniref:Uncharacterized protein n=1 Tax=Synaphobranchus kaupii TaxID=118154 RepID=A0A9Q1J7P9_SYNKA|nr:hypothetical protein SKAU_G00040660 [Synaphobranchus kaupii]
MWCACRTERRKGEVWQVRRHKEEAQGVWLLVLLAAAGRTSHAIPKEGGCQESGTTAKPHWMAPCLRKWLSLVRNVDEGIVTSNDEYILVRPVVLTKIKGRAEYGCILKKIFEFYDKVLAEGQRKARDYGDLRHLLGRLKRCRLKVHCPALCRKLNREARKKPVMEANNVSCLEHRELAVFQIQKLQRAEDRLTEDVKTLDKAIVELKGLHFYESNTEVVMSKKCPVENKEKTLNVKGRCARNDP